VVVFELVIALLFAGAMLAAWGRRFSLPYPALLALAGAGLALLPGVPDVTLDPELALALFVAPVLLDAAFDSSPRDLKENWRVVTSLALIAVGLTVAAVALVVKWLVPALPWPAAITLGAIVAPPDAAAATTVLRQLKAPHRIFVILEGESLFNDATALLIYRLAVGAAMTGAFSGWSALPALALATAGSIVLALIWVRLIRMTIGRIEDVATSVITQFVGTFVLWIVAERLRLSGIITVVVFAITIARTAPDTMPARLRIPSYAVWEVAVFVLNVLAFILVGLQLGPILERLDRVRFVTYASVAATVFVAVVLVRIVWVMGYSSAGQWFRNLRPVTGPPQRYPSYREGVVIAWCGMRGLVTIAAALALPHGPPASAFPYRDLILFTAFCVVVGTLVIQGLTVTPLMRALRLQSDDSVAQEVRRARAETARAGLAAIRHRDADETDEMSRLLVRKYEARLGHAEADEVAGGEVEDEALSAYGRAVERAQAAERRTLLDLRTRGVIGDDAFHRVEEELDWAEVSARSHQNQQAQG
jgi:Na+/H+ antiporter